MSAYAKLRRDLVAASTVVDGETVYNLKDPIRGTYFRLREPEYWLVRQLDGETSYDDIAARFQKKFQLNISGENVRQFVYALADLFFLEDSRSEQAVSRRSYRTKERSSLFSRLLFVKLNAYRPGRFLDWLAAAYRPLHNRYVFGLICLLILAGFWVVFTNPSYFALSMRGVFNISSILVIVTSIFIMIVIHEFAHAVVCRYFGGEVREMGFLLLYFQPCFYCNLSDAWLFENKRHRLAVTAVGPFFQLILLAVAALVWRVTVIGSAVNDLAQIVAVISYVTVLFNFNPLIKLDGYYLLADWLDIPNLRAKSFGYLAHVIKRKILGWPVAPMDISRRHRRIFITYSLLAVVYSAFLLTWIFLVIASFLVAEFGRFGLLLLVVVLLYTLRQTFFSIAAGFVEHLKYMNTLFKRPWRLFAHVVVVVSVLVLLLAVPFPKRVTGEVNIRPLAECTLRLNELGLLETTYRRGGKNADRKTSYLQMASTDMASLHLLRLVKDGQYVREGDSVAVLVSNQVSQEIMSETSVLEKAVRELELLKAPPKKEAIAEAEAQINAARANYEQKLRDYKLVSELAMKEWAADYELKAAGSAVDVAEAELKNREAALQLLLSGPRPEEIAVLQAEIDKRKARLDFLKSQQAAQTIRAPMSGRIDLKEEPGLLLTIVDDQVIELLVPVSDFDVDLVKDDLAVRLKVRSYADDVFTGRVVSVPQSAQIYDDKAVFPVSVLVENDDGRLRSGMSGYAKIECGETSLLALIAREIASQVRVEFWSWW